MIKTLNTSHIKGGVLPTAVIVFTVFILIIAGLFCISNVASYFLPPEQIQFDVNDTVSIPYSVGIFTPTGITRIITHDTGTFAVTISTDSPSDQVNLKYWFKGQILDSNKFGSYNAPYERYYPLFSSDDGCTSDQWKDCNANIVVPAEVTDSILHIGVSGHGTGNITVTRISG
jgi:hypothetical protein